MLFESKKIVLNGLHLVKTFKWITVHFIMPLRLSLLYLIIIRYFQVQNENKNVLCLHDAESTPTWLKTIKDSVIEYKIEMEQDTDVGYGSNQQIPHKHIQSMCINPAPLPILLNYRNNPLKITDKFQAYVSDSHSSLQCYLNWKI